MNRMIVYVGSILVDENRNEGGQGDIAALAANIKEFGQINAVTVVATPQDPEHPYKVVDGRRRIAAFRLLAEQNPDDGWDEITADIYAEEELPGGEEAFALAANTARLEMNPLDEGIAFARMLADGKDAGEIAAVFCRTKAQVYQRARLASLPESLKDLYRAGQIDTRDALRIAELDSDSQQVVSTKLDKDDRIYSWDVRDAISAAVTDIIGANFFCDECAVCRHRTHFGDETLFPDMGNETDRCLDHECYMRRWKAAVEEAVKAHPEVKDFVSVSGGTILGAKPGDRLEVCGRDMLVVSEYASGEARISFFWNRIPGLKTHKALCLSGGEWLVREFVFAKDERKCEKLKDEKKTKKEREKRLESVPPAAREACMKRLTDKQERNLLDVKAKEVAFERLERSFNTNSSSKRYMQALAVEKAKYMFGESLPLFLKLLGIKPSPSHTDMNSLLAMGSDYVEAVYNAIPIMLIAAYTGYDSTYGLNEAYDASGAFFDKDEFRRECVRRLYEEEIADAEDDAEPEDASSADDTDSPDANQDDVGETDVSDDEHRDVTDLSKISDADELRANSKN